MTVEQKKKITVLLDPDDFDRFHRFCKERGFKKSTLIVRLIHEHLQKEGAYTQRRLPFSNGGGGREGGDETA